MLRITVTSPKVTVADPDANFEEIHKLITANGSSDIILFPELSITGYTCGDLFSQDKLLRKAIETTLKIASLVSNRQLVVVGVPVQVNNNLYNAAAVLHGGEVIGIVPKQYLPNYREFYEARWFTAADGSEPSLIRFGEEEVPFGIDLLFRAGEVVVGVEICEDLWVPIPPSSFQAIAGANVLLNLSASNETVAKSAYRRELVSNQSGRCIAAYAYASSGPSESTTDLVFGGHCLVAESGTILEESCRFVYESNQLTTDIDIEKITHERRKTTTFNFSKSLRKPFREVTFILRSDGFKKTVRYVDKEPFVPKDESTLKERCSEIFGIQVSALAKRVAQLPKDSKINIGISGGLDSTLSLLVAVKACDQMGWSRNRIRGITMPGFGTTDKTKNNAIKLMDQLGIDQETIDIRPACLQAFADLGHKPFGIDTAKLPNEINHALCDFNKLLLEHATGKQDVVFENVQARLRTFYLMSKGFVLGTGDLSEAAAGWCTYNGDHMSMYNPNCSIPKTLVKFLVKFIAVNEFEPFDVMQTLLSIVDTTISPELLPVDESGEITQSTEEIIGPYDLQDFFLNNMIRCGFTPEKIQFLAEIAFKDKYDPATIEKWRKSFYKRFFNNQFKRSCVPDGPKVGSVSLSPRGDWRMPSDASPAAWLS